MKTYKYLFSLLFWILPLNQSFATESLKLQKVTQDVYAIVGELGNRTPENLGNNATFGFVVTTKGVVLIDSGGTYNGAKAIHSIIKSVTNKPIVKVINTGGQDHRWVGNGYFKQHGAQIIASEAAVKDQKSRVNDQFFMLGNLVGEEEIKLTNPVYAEKVFQNKFSFKLGDVVFEIYHAGQAHTPGDSFVWLPQKDVMFTGDIVYTERMLGILGYSNSKSWIKVYQAMSAFNPKHLIPGHGHATNLDQARKDTYDYLVNLRKAVTNFMESGGDITEIRNIDHSKFAYLFSYDILSGRNAQQVYTEIEWE